MKYYVPSPDSKGERYHSSNHTGDDLVEASEEEVRKRIKVNGLEPCKNCMEHHGLEPLE